MNSGFAAAWEGLCGEIYYGHMQSCFIIACEEIAGFLRGPRTDFARRLILRDWDNRSFKI